MRSILIAILFVFISTLQLTAQRRVTPVTPQQPTHRVETDEKGRVHRIPNSFVLGDSLKTDSLPKDTLKGKMIYPLLHNITVGVNIWDPLMRAFGQSYGGADVSVELSMWNRIFPTLEIGIGMANSTPEDANFTYKSKAALYGKIGASYNFLYNKTPDYQLLGGFRFGFSSFSYDITDIKLNSGYWDQTAGFDILNQKSHASWAEILLGIKVKVYKNISMGWSFRYRIMMSYKKNINSDPWYIPGMGSRTASSSGTFSIFYTIPFKNKKISPLPVEPPK